MFSGLSDGCCCQETDEWKQLLLEPSDYRNDQLQWGGGNVGCPVNSLRHFCRCSWELHTQLDICPHIFPVKVGVVYFVSGYK